MRLIRTVIVCGACTLDEQRAPFTTCTDPDTILAATALLVSAQSDSTDASDSSDPTAGLLSDFPTQCLSSCSVFNNVVSVSGIVHTHKPLPVPRRTPIAHH